MSSLSSQNQPFRYCPCCRSTRVNMQGIKQLQCAQCGFEFYVNTAAAVAGLITDNDGNLLVTVRAKEPGKGTCDLPGGFVDPGESAEEALQREVKEELDLHVISMTYFCSEPNLYEYKRVAYSTLDLAYLCQVEDASNAVASDDVDSVIFKSPSEIDLDEFGLDSIRSIVSRYINTRSR